MLIAIPELHRDERLAPNAPKAQPERMPDMRRRRGDRVVVRHYALLADTRLTALHGTPAERIVRRAVLAHLAAAAALANDVKDGK